MFGNSEWFSENLTPWPRSAKGWWYYLIWLSVVAGPAALLVGRGQIPECLIWLVVSGVVFLLDLRRIRVNIRQREELGRLHHIDDNEPVEIETELYRFEIRP